LRAVSGVVSRRAAISAGESTAADWEQVHPVEGTSVVLDVTIDDVYWGVRAVGTAGTSGLPAVAWRR
jgi:hypothetical protein